jgi:endonuclease G
MASAEDIHDPQHCLFGCPEGSPSTNDIIREIYILSSDDLTKLADWVAYRVTKDTIGPSENRVWKADPLLEDRDELHGDCILAGDYLSNITPQKSDLNQGAWATLEGKVRNLARQPGVEGVFVMTGPLYERPMPELPRADEAHMVPSGYWKIVALPDGATAKVAAFYFDQDTSRNSNYCDHLITVDDIEARSGLDFFHELAGPVQNSLEAAPASLTSELGCSP